MINECIAMLYTFSALQEGKWPTYPVAAALGVKGFEEATPMCSVKRDLVFELRDGSRWEVRVKKHRVAVKQYKKAWAR